MRKLHRVAQQVVQHLLEAQPVGVERDSRRHGSRKVERFRHGLRTDRRHHFLHRLQHVEGAQPQIEPAGFDAAQIQDIVDQLQQVKRILVDIRGEPLLLFIERPLQFLRQKLEQPKELAGSPKLEHQTA